ncbi:MAG: NAD(P)H-dependent oxidoreductase [Candidatus Pacebacteria bacterium]|nr:NAD(P)H-dependent oxidoreductase [Candidatus Paceibacterota bacterium]MBP9842607.1 NAD(P)H-dependent oxidoreductase [Candidatus Paceibacterota bacterium]
MLNVKVIVGSTRPSRFSEKVLPWLETELGNRNDMNIEVLDLREYELPYFDMPMSPAYVQNGEYGNDVVNAWAKKIGEADAYLIIAPEYNHGYTAVLKNALDVVYGEWNKKAVGFVSYGSVGGGRVVEQLRQVAVELQMASTRNAVHIQAPWFLLEEDGSLKTGALDVYTDSLKGMLDQLAWWGQALKEARQK